MCRTIWTCAIAAAITTGGQIPYFATRPPVTRPACSVASRPAWAKYGICPLVLAAAPPPTRLAAAGSEAASAPASQPAAARELTLELGGKVTMKLVLVLAGKFPMGSAADDPNRFGNELPRHEVTIGKPFYMGPCEVTRGQFAAFVKGSGYQTDVEKVRAGLAPAGEPWRRAKAEKESWRTPGFEQTDDHPVVCVSYNDAVAFCRWLTKKTGRTVKLPTEAQWEYACRAGTTTTYPWGDEAARGKGWCNGPDQAGKRQHDDWKVFAWDDGYVHTAPVGRFRPNAFGLHDMIGNVWEWCADWYDEAYYRRGDNTDPQGPAAGAARVLRGGSWNPLPAYCRSAVRSWDDPSHWHTTAGFRVVVDAAGAK